MKSFPTSYMSEIFAIGRFALRIDAFKFSECLNSISFVTSNYSLFHFQFVSKILISF